MTTNGDTGQPEELTDAQLDQFLETANSQLLDHIRATADRNRTLAAIMAGDDAGLAAVIIRLRSRVHDFEIAVAHDRDLARDLASAIGPGRPIGRARELYRNLIGGLERAHDLARDFARELELDTTLIRDLVLDIVRDLDLGLLYDLDVDFIRDLDLVLNLDPARDLHLGSQFSVIRELGDIFADRYIGDPSFPAPADRYRGLVRAPGVARALESDLARPLALARALGRVITAHPVDASGADLSNAEIKDLKILDRVIWTRETIWPVGIAEQVREHSEEITEGVYQVRIGSTPERSLTLV